MQAVADGSEPAAPGSDTRATTPVHPNANVIESFLWGALRPAIAIILASAKSRASLFSELFQIDETRGPPHYRRSNEQSRIDL